MTYLWSKIISMSDCKGLVKYLVGYLVESQRVPIFVCFQDLFYVFKCCWQFNFIPSLTTEAIVLPFAWLHLTWQQGYNS